MRMHLNLRLTAFLAAISMALLVSIAARGAEAPYEKQLLRLAEVLGSVQYLRNLCGEEGNQWRDRMQALLESEDPDPARRARLVASFNHGYRTFRDSYAHCTASALEAIRRYMQEGETLSGDIASRYGN